MNYNRKKVKGMPKELSMSDLMATEPVKEKPQATKSLENKPEATGPLEDIPIPKELEKIIPSIRKDENCIKIGNRLIEIFPTKLKYFRNKTATVYSIFDSIPLTDFFAYTKGVFDNERDSDQIMYDFLVAVFDDEKLIHKNYENITTDDIEQILKIFDRVNHISEKKEKARKNREAQMTR